MTIIYPMPPVQITGNMWSIQAPVSKSESLWTGYRSRSTSNQTKRIATVVVSAWGNDYTGAGYCQNLINLLDGGINYVRLNSGPIQWFPDIATNASERSAQGFDWLDDGDLVDWDTTWIDGAYLTGTITTSGEHSAVVVSGLPANKLIARPSEYIAIYTVSGTEYHRAFNVAYSDESGVATIKLMTTPSGGGRVSIGESENAVFEINGDMPTVMNTAGSDFSITFNFIEVLPEQYAGATEKDEDYWIG